MKKFMKVVSMMLICTVGMIFTGCDTQKSQKDANTLSEEFNVVASFYPMHILAMNLTRDIEGVSEKSMSDPNLGCIHDHTFTTEDLKKVEGANVYVENGLGLEVFNEKLKEAYPDIAIIEACENITDYVADGEEKNAHVWTNIDDYIQQVQYVSSQLQVLDAENKESYAANEEIYIEKLIQLKEDYKDTLQQIAGKKVLVLDETLPSFCVFTQLEQYTIKTDHEQEVISANQIKETIDTMKKQDIKAILIAKGTDRKNAETIAKETGATIYELNSCMVGEEYEDAYLNDMKENFEIIVDIQ